MNTLHGCANKMHEEKAKLKLHKNTKCCFEQILEAPSYKTVTVRPLTSHLKNYPSTRHGWRNKDELMSDIFLWTPIHGSACVELQAKTYLHQLCADTQCSLEDLLGAMDYYRDGWRKRERVRVREILASVRLNEDDICI